eukprot:SAG11_NODE_1801_length_4241_cov_7.942781_2_plen_71_part_00
MRPVATVALHVAPVLAPELDGVQQPQPQGLLTAVPGYKPADGIPFVDAKRDPQIARRFERARHWLRFYER